MSDIVNRLRQPLSMSMFATSKDLYAEQEHLRSDAADRIEQLERENAELRHDIERYVAISAELATELESARSQARREAMEDAANLIEQRNADCVDRLIESLIEDEVAAIRRLAKQEAPEPDAIRKMEA